METIIKPFEALSPQEIFQIFRARVSVFVVEQHCPYQEIDDADPVSTHIFFREGGALKAYLRVFERDETTAQIGRVISLDRGKGLGAAILQEGIRFAREDMGKRTAYLEGQTYIRRMYENAGFRQCTEEFLEDGIPHIGMTMEL